MSENTQSLSGTGSAQTSRRQFLRAVTVSGVSSAVVTGLARATRPGDRHWLFRTPMSVASTPTVVNGIAYIKCRNGYVYAVDAGTGKERWRFETDGGGYESAPAVSEGTVFMLGKSSLYAVDAETGKRQWQFPQGTQLKGSLTVATVPTTRAAHGEESERQIAVFGGSDAVYAVDAANGQEVWQFSADPGWGNRGDIYPTVTNTPSGDCPSESAMQMTVCFSDQDGAYAIDARTGEKLWQTDRRYLYGIPTVHCGTVFVGSMSSVCALNARTGDQQWRFETKGRVSGRRDRLHRKYTPAASTA